MRIFNKVLCAHVEASPAALLTVVFLLKAFYRQPLQALVVTMGLLAGFGLVFYFLINPPEVVTISQASSPELRKFVEENQYIKIAGYYGWIDTNFDIMVQPDSSIQAPPEIR